MPQRITFGQPETAGHRTERNFKIETFAFDKELEADLPPQRQVMLMFDDQTMDD